MNEKFCTSTKATTKKNQKNLTKEKISHGKFSQTFSSQNLKFSFLIFHNQTKVTNQCSSTVHLLNGKVIINRLAL